MQKKKKSKKSIFNYKESYLIKYNYNSI